MDARRAQGLLAKMGLPPTAAGVARFQVLVKLPPTGAIDDRTAWALTQARVAPDNVRLAGFNSFGIIAPPVGTAAKPLIRTPPTPEQTYTGVTGLLPGASQAPVVVQGGVASQGGGRAGLILKAAVFLAVAGGSFYFYRRSQKKLVVNGYDDAGPVLSLGPRRAKRKRSRTRAMGSKEGRGVEPGEGAPEADVQKGYNPRARRFLRRQREMYPVLTPDVPMEAALRREKHSDVSEEEWKEMTEAQKYALRKESAAERRATAPEDAAARAKWTRAGKKRGPVGPGKGVVESSPTEGSRGLDPLAPDLPWARRTAMTKQHIIEENIERFLQLPNMSKAERARLSKAERAEIEQDDKDYREKILKAGGEEDEDGTFWPAYRTEVRPSHTAAPRVVRLDADEKMWKQQHQYRNDMKRMAHERANANQTEVQVVQRGTHRVIYSAKPRY